jgi:outer membrane lipoprotein-sorting protein
MMCLARRVGVGVLVVMTPLILTSCAAGRQRTIARGALPATQTLLAATKTDLIRSIADFYGSIQSFSTTVNMTPSVGSVYKGKITDYTDVAGYIDFRKPADIRVVGLAPVVRSTAFHMVSDGKQFRVYLPINNKFIEGSNDAPAISQNKLENFRPETFLNSMLIRPVDLEHELTVMVDDTTESSTYYQLSIIRKVPGNENDIEEVRRITFDRVNLRIVEQREYDDEGSITSLTRYSNWQAYSGIQFPAHIDISRPKDGYGVELLINKIDLNVPVPDTRFVLARPEGTELQIIGSGSGKPSFDLPHSHSKVQK